MITKKLEKRNCAHISVFCANRAEPGKNYLKNVLYSLLKLKQGKKKKKKLGR